MPTTTKVAFRALGASAAVIFFAACTQEQQPFEPDARANLPQASGADVRVARVIEPDQLGLANPAGLAFSPGNGTLLLVTRTPGTPPGSATDIELITLDEDRVGSVRIAAAVADPVNMAFDGDANRLLIFQSANNQLIEILARSDGSLDPQTLRRVDAGSWGLKNPQGLTVDPASGQLFILDAGNSKIFGVEPDPQLGFERPIVSEIDLAWAGSADLRGLAFDPTNGHLHVLEPAAQALYELTETGDVVATRDLSGFDFHNPQGMTFGPSGDSTDDPLQMNLYIADSGLGGAGSTFAEIGHITELTFELPPAPPAALFAPEVATLIQTIRTYQFNPPSPDPAGITRIDGDRLLISDSEVNEMKIFKDVNLFEIDADGRVYETGNTTIHQSNNEPTGVTWNPANNHIFISNDDRDEIYEMDAGSDGVYGTSDDIVTSFDTGAFGSGDPEGVAFDASQGVLYIVDGVDAEVYRVSPGSNGVFDGTGGSGDDQVTHFDTKRLGLTDPEGIVWDSDTGHLYGVGKPVNTVFHFTTTGDLVREIDISAANADKPAGLGYAPSSVNPGQMSLYCVDRNVDNNSNSNENDGELYEFMLPSFDGNTMPTVSITAPANGSASVEGDPVTFTGTATDSEDGDLTASLSWTSSRDGTIGSGGSFTTSALSPGTHTITASVTDSGDLQGFDAITVTINVEGLNTIEVRVAGSSDDSEEESSGRVDLTSSDLEMVFDGSDQTVGMRFNGITVPPGATIFSAYIQFQADETQSVATSLTLQAEASDNAGTFENVDWNVSSRSRTAASVSWSPPSWNTVGEAGAAQRTPDISALIQEIVDRSGWSSGNSLAIIVTGTGERVAESYNGTSSAAPLLHIGYVVESSQNDPPVANDDDFTGNPVDEGGTLTNLNVLANDTDSDGSLDAKTVTITGATNGVATVNPNGTVNFTHDGSETSTASFTYTVDDDGGATSNVATASLAVSPVNDPPVANDDDFTSTLVAEGGTLTNLNVLANDTDVDGTLDVTTVTITGATNGVATANADGTVNFTHDGSATTTASFTYTVDDDGGATSNAATASLAVGEVNDPPVANDDDLTGNPVDEGGTLTNLNVLANDTDSDGSLDATSVTITGATNGVATANSDGTVNFTHDGSETSTASFTYTVDDDGGATSNVATASLAVNAVNDPPVAFDDAGSVVEGGTLNEAAPGVLSNDSDPEGDQLTVSATPITPPAHGTLTLNADGSYSYTHDGSATTIDSFQYEISDGNGGTDTATVNLTITGQPGTVVVLTPSGIDGYSTVGGKNSDRHLQVLVTLVDGTGAPIAGATVTATISGPTTGGGTLTTDASGTALFKITNAPSGTYTTTLDEVIATGFTWDGNTPPNSFSK
jgi:VCBS repeat-containing protein